MTLGDGEYFHRYHFESRTGTVLTFQLSFCPTSLDSFCTTANEIYELLYSISIAEEENEVALFCELMKFFTFRRIMSLYSLQSSMLPPSMKCLRIGFDLILGVLSETILCYLYWFLYV